MHNHKHKLKHNRKHNPENSRKHNRKHIPDQNLYIYYTFISNFTKTGL
jgi:hypothetical protein